MDHPEVHAAGHRRNHTRRLRRGLRAHRLRGLVAHRRRRRLRIPLHGRALSAGLPRLGRHARIAFLRIRPRRLHVLRPLRRLDMAGGGRRGSLRPGDRHTADGQQLP